MVLDIANRVDKHPATQELANLEKALNAAAERAKDDLSAIQLIGRHRGVLEFARSRMRSADPALAPDNVLQALVQQFQSWRGLVEQYVSQANAGFLQNASANTDGATQLLMQLPLLPSKAEGDESARVVRAYYETVREYVEGVAARLTQLQSQASTWSGQVSQLETQATNAVAQVQSAITAQQQQFSQAQEQRVNEFGRAQQERVTEFNAFVVDRRSAIDNTIKEAADRFEASLAAEQEQVAALLDDARTRLTASAEAGKLQIEHLETEFRARAEAIVSDLNAKKTEADKLVGIIGERGVTSNYQRVANEARVEMWGWHAVTVVALGALIGAAVFEFLPALRGGWNWGAFAGRLFVTIACTALAGYAASQARSSQRAMRENRQREMDLAAVGPYLAPLPEQMQQEFRLKFADRTFAGPVPLSADGSSEGAALLENPDVRKIILELAKVAIQAGKSGGK